MTPKDKVPTQTKRNTKPPRDGVAKQEQKQKAEKQEVAGRHKQDGQKDHKGRR
jgi:hypothetical protein